jgi:hypothetical protein
MAYSWALFPEPSDDAGLNLDVDFADQGSAESWLTENYLELDDLGVREVSLYEEGRLIYGPMSLEA